MSSEEIVHQRLINQQLISTKFEEPIELLRWFGAMQAQEFAQTKWSFGLRMPHLADSNLEKDFASGKILRTHVLRPTWHFVAAEDIRWMLELTKARVHATNAYMYRQLELDKKILTTCVKLITQVLERNIHLTRDAINDTFKNHKINAEGHRLSYIMMYAELEGIVCSGPRQGNQFTYGLLEERVPKTSLKNEDESLALLTRMYFQSRGPATVYDFSTWSGLTLTTCRKGVDIIQSEIQKEVLDDAEYIFFPTVKKKISNAIQFLPIYDEYIMGYKNRDAILHFYHTIKSKPVFGFDNTLVQKGQIIGTWKRTIKTKNIILQHHFFKPLTASQQIEFKKSLKQYERFTGLNITVE